MFETRRVIVIFRHDSPFHKTHEFKGEYGICLINKSFVRGEGYVIPRGDSVHVVNTYIGFVRFPFLEDGKLNPSAEVKFDQCYYNDRYNNRKWNDTPFYISPMADPHRDLFDDFTGHFGPLIPQPEFYNDEHQRRVGDETTAEWDFWMDGAIKPYFLAQLIDQRTSIIQTDVSMGFTEQFSDGYSQHRDNSDKPDWLVFETFVSLYECVMHSQMRQALVIFDTDVESYNITNLITNFKDSYDSRQFGQDKAKLIEDIQREFDIFLERLFNYTQNVRQSAFRYTFQVFFLISEACCRIKIADINYGGRNVFSGELISPKLSRSKDDLDRDVIERCQ
jgi:hypothetical protein